MSCCLHSKPFFLRNMSSTPSSTQRPSWFLSLEIYYIYRYILAINFVRTQCRHKWGALTDSRCHVWPLKSCHLNNAFSYNLPASLFLFGMFFYRRATIFSQFFAFLGHFLCIPGNMNDARVVIEMLLVYCSTASTAQHSTAQHSTAQHSTAQSARTKPQSKYVPIRARQRKPAHRVGERQHIHVEHWYSTRSCQNERRNRHVPGLQKNTGNTVTTHSQRWFDARRICLYYWLTVT